MCATASLLPIPPDRSMGSRSWTGRSTPLRRARCAPAGETWVELQARLNAQLAPLSGMAMDRAEIRSGERILDVGCGTGQTTLELASRVGPEGSVLGLDISGPMLDFAKRRREAAGI